MAASPQHETLTRRLTSTGKAAEIEAMLEPTLEAMGFRIVRVLLSGNERQKRLQIMAERLDGTMDVDGCAEISRAAEAILDVEDPIPTGYTLEVSSPGIDRPLTRVEDFERWAGFDAKIELAASRDGRRRFKGRLLGRDGDSVRIAADDGEWQLPFAEIEKAKLVMTDELMQAAQKAADARQAQQDGDADGTGRGDG